MAGQVGKLLRVDLTSAKVREQLTSDYARFIGGVGVAAKIYFDEVAPTVEPFDPENLLIMMTGPLTGTPAPGSGITLWYSKSPVGYPVGVCRPSAMGGELGAELKYAGYDGLIIEGRADKPVYLSIEDGKVEIKDAADLWGKDTYETQATLVARHGRGTQTAAIGPSGERLGRMASIVHKTGHASGMSGYGGVMGSKQLKALAVRGSGSVRVAQPEQLLELTKKATALVYDRDNPPRVTGMRGLRYAPGWPGFLEKYGRGMMACHGCPIACLGVFDVPGVPLAADSCSWPHSMKDAETGMSAGFEPNEQGWMNNWELNVTVNRLGMSIWETTELFEFLIRLRDAGLITEEETGLPLSGDHRELWLALVKQIAYRQGIGDILSEQLPRAAEKIGRGSEHFFTHFNGWALNLLFDDPRAHPMMAMLASTGSYFAYAEPWFFWAVFAGEYHLPVEDPRSALSADEIAAISSRVFGSATMVDPITFKGKAEVTIHSQHYRMLADSLPFCRWVMHYDVDYYKEGMEGDSGLLAKLYSAVTGCEMDQEGLLKIGERLVNLDRAQGIKHNYRSRAHDLAALDERSFNEPFEISPLPGQVVNRDDLHAEIIKYYRLRGWDAQTGIPTEAKLEELDLADVAGVLSRLGTETDS